VVPEQFAPASASEQISFLRVFPSIMLPMFLAAVDQTIVADGAAGLVPNEGNYSRLCDVVTRV